MTQMGSTRFDGDSWDLASSVGATATMVAAARARAMRRFADAMAIRTEYFDNFFLDATQGGIRQAVILAGSLLATDGLLDVNDRNAAELRGRLQRHSDVAQRLRFTGRTRAAGQHRRGTVR